MSIKLRELIFLQRLFYKVKPDQGFTIIESLMAVVVVAVLVVAITPPIFLAVATRVQNQRAEQAMQQAQRQIDQIRALIERGDETQINKYLPPDATTLIPDAKGKKNILIADAPTIFTDSCTFPLSNFKTACGTSVDSDQNGKPDYYVQTFRTNEQTSGSKRVAFDMGVRVYSHLAKNQTNLQIEAASLKFTTGQGSQRQKPLAVFYTQVLRGDSKDTLKNLNTTSSP